MEVVLLNGIGFGATLNAIDNLTSKGYYVVWPADVPALQKALDVLLNHFKKPEFKSLLNAHTELQQSITILRQLRCSIDKAEKATDGKVKRIREIEAQKEATRKLLEDIVNDLKRPEQGILSPWKVDLLARAKAALGQHVSNT